MTHLRQVEHVQLRPHEGAAQAPGCEAVVLEREPVRYVLEPMHDHTVLDAHERRVDAVLLVEGVGGEHLDVVAALDEVDGLLRHHLGRAAVGPGRCVVGHHLADAQGVTHG